MLNNQIETTITTAFHNKPIFEGLESNQDFFDLGASSLTVVELQIKIESDLNLEIDTSVLMMNPTIEGWIAKYTEKSNA